MMNFQWLFISIIFIVLSLVHINASKYQRQTTVELCPNVTACDYVQCGNGQCIENKTSIECYTCICKVGFTGKTCDTQIVTPNGCNPACQNGGQCQQTIANTYTCVCPQNFTGSQCETSVLAIHPCTTMPGTVCQNGGTCTINGAGYLCSCPIGWSGTDCRTQTSIISCTPNPCGTHGTCLQAVLPTNELAIFCRCDAQWTGQYCDVNLAGNCPTGFCQSGGICQMNGNVPYCLCPSTHTGQQCETLIPTLTTMTSTMTTTVTGIFTTTSTSTARPSSGNCASNPCLNGGSCFNTGNTFICLCTVQYSGPTCTVQNSVTTPYTTTTSGTDACSPNPCNNGGACYKYLNGFVCVCTAQFTGQTCNMAKTAPPSTTPSSAITCANQPCRNGATCYSTTNSYFCYCGTNSNYSGTNCDIPKGTADPNCPLDCLPGYCILADSTQNTYACMCNGSLTPTSCSSK